MKFMIKNAWLIMGLATALTAVTPQARGVAFPEFSDGSFSDVTTAGLDGNLRLVFDLFSDTTFTTFVGQNIWVVSPGGTVLAASATSIPGTVSRTYVEGQADGNTSVLFVFPNNAIGLWTYNPSGSVVASVVYGPFDSNTVVTEVKRQETTGQFLVTWGSTVPTGTAVSAWTINEFGGIVTAAGPYGPFTNTVSRGVNLLKNGTQEWVWATTVSGSTTTELWQINSAGTVTGAEQFGPF